MARGTISASVVGNSWRWPPHRRVQRVAHHDTIAANTSLPIAPSSRR